MNQETLKLLRINEKNGCGKYLKFTGDFGNREMILCGKDNYEYHKKLFVQCDKCKKMAIRVK